MPDSHAVCHYSIFQSQLSEMPQQGSRGITKPSCTEQRLYSTSLSVLFRFISPQQQIEGFEQLLRRLLKLPHQPAIVVVHWWSPVHDCSKSQQVSLSTQVIVLRPIFIAEEHKFVVYFLLSYLRPDHFIAVAFSISSCILQQTAATRQVLHCGQVVVNACPAFRFASKQGYVTVQQKAI